MANLFGKITGNLRRHAVGDDVQRAGECRADDHQAAPFDDLANLLRNDDAFENVAENIREQKLNEGAQRLDTKPDRHSAVKGLQITEHDVHLSVSSFS